MRRIDRNITAPMKSGNAPVDEKLSWGISQATMKTKRLKASRNHMRKRSPGLRSVFSSMGPNLLDGFSGRVAARPESA